MDKLSGGSRKRLPRADGHISSAGGASRAGMERTTSAVDRKRSLYEKDDLDQAFDTIAAKWPASATKAKMACLSQNYGDKSLQVTMYFPSVTIDALDKCAYTCAISEKGLASLLMMPEHLIRRCLAPIHSLLNIAGGKVQFMHKSVADYLLSQDRSELCLDAAGIVVQGVHQLALPE
ncbi:hypothetical protein HDU83_007436 [Entophlyctis luteolus]|nr:hypothetical protein HDU83_007436 [Entophlyctis luteolus]